MLGRAADGATQPEVEVVPLFSARCLNTSRLIGSTGLASKGERSERPVSKTPGVWCGSCGRQ